MSTAEERFWKFVQPEPNTGCWLWGGAQNAKGYGHFWSGTRPTKAHRWAYERFVGIIPDGLTIDHLCRVTCCVNPEHMEVVTSRTNSLRSGNACALHARKTHCHRGHILSSENLIAGELKRGARRCKICYRDYQRDYQRVLRAKRLAGVTCM